MRGSQRPRVESRADGVVSSAGQEAVDLARLAGLDLDPWQEHVLEHALGERADGKWAAFEVGLVVPRQNGKGSILEARELAGLFLLDERLIIHSAHEFATSLEAFRRLLSLIEDNLDFSRRVKRVSRAHGEEGIELTTGQRIRFRTRTKGGGRGFSGDCLILDEAMILPATAHAALLPTLSARPNSQVWYVGSAVDREVHEHGVVLSRIRKRGMAADEPRLAYFEWSAAGELDQAAAIAADQDAWAQANPGLGIRIEPENVALEQRSLDPKAFAVERLSIGDWHRLDGSDDDGIDPDAWLALTDERSRPEDPVVLSFDVRPNRGAAAIAAAGHRTDDLSHHEVIEHKAGTRWVPDRLAELVKAHRVTAIVYSARSPAASLVPAIEDLGLGHLLVEASAADEAEACGVLFDAVRDRTTRHLGTSELEAALRGAARKPNGDAWSWSRKNSAVDISPLVACTLALWKLGTARPSVYERRPLLVLS